MCIDGMNTHVSVHVSLTCGRTVLAIDNMLATVTMQTRTGPEVV